MLPVDYLITICLNAPMLWRRPAWLRFAAGALVWATACGCDPSQDPPVWRDGPAFLTVAVAARQPSSPDLGIALYLQGRGGNLVGIATRGATHRYADLAMGVSASCTGLPGSRPLYFTAIPATKEITIEARLYNVCDLPDADGPSSGYDPCAIAGPPVITTLVPVEADAWVDAAVGLAGSGPEPEHVDPAANLSMGIPECIR